MIYSGPLLLVSDMAENPPWNAYDFEEGTPVAGELSPPSANPLWAPATPRRHAPTPFSPGFPPNPPLDPELFYVAVPSREGTAT